MDIRLYHFPGTRSTRVRWLLEELDIAYELELVDVLQGAHKTADYARERHPHMLLPAMEIDGMRLIESSAMVLHLADLFPDAKLAPPIGTPERALYYQWIVYAPATLDEACIALYFHMHLLPPERRKQDIVIKHRPTWELAAGFLERTLRDRPFLLGESFSAADVAVGYDVALAHQLGLTAGRDALSAYANRLVARPAFQHAYAR